jgi:hypothetical protein
MNRRLRGVETQAEQDFAIIVEQKRKSIGVYARLAATAAIDLGGLLLRATTPFDRDRYIYEGTRNMARYCQDNNIRDITLLDKSARPLWVGIGEYWKRAYPDEVRPNIHFINPALFREATRESKSPAELAASLEAVGGFALEQLRESGSPLAAKRDQPIMLADACMHSGKSVYLTKRALETVGFTDLHVGVINTTIPTTSPVAPDIFGTDNVVAARCFRSSPEDSLVVNAHASIHSARIDDPYVFQRGTEVRRFISDLVAERFAIKS